MSLLRNDPVLLRGFFPNIQNEFQEFFVFDVNFIEVKSVFFRCHMPTVTYLRLDGSTAAGQRHSLVQRYSFISTDDSISSIQPNLVFCICREISSRWKILTLLQCKQQTSLNTLHKSNIYTTFISNEHPENAHLYTKYISKQRFQFTNL